MGIGEDGFWRIAIDTDGCRISQDTGYWTKMPDKEERQRQIAGWSSNHKYEMLAEDRRCPCAWYEIQQDFLQVRSNYHSGAKTNGSSFQTAATYQYDL